MISIDVISCARGVLFWDISQERAVLDELKPVDDTRWNWFFVCVINNAALLYVTLLLKVVSVEIRIYDCAKYLSPFVSPP